MARCRGRVILLIFRPLVVRLWNFEMESPEFFFFFFFSFNFLHDRFLRQHNNRPRFVSNCNSWHRDFRLIPFSDETYKSQIDWSDLGRPKGKTSCHKTRQWLSMKTKREGYGEDDPLVPTLAVVLVVVVVMQDPQPTTAPLEQQCVRLEATIRSQWRSFNARKNQWR